MVARTAEHRSFIDEVAVVAEEMGIQIDVQELKKHPARIIAQMHKLRKLEGKPNKDADVYAAIAESMADNDPAMAIDLANAALENVDYLEEVWGKIAEVITLIRKSNIQRGLTPANIKQEKTYQAGQGLEQALPRLSALEKAVPEMLRIATQLRRDLQALKMRLNGILSVDYTNYADNSETQGTSIAEQGSAVLDVIHQHQYKLAALMTLVVSLLVGGRAEAQTLPADQTTVQNKAEEEGINETDAINDSVSVLSLITEAATFIAEEGNIEQMVARFEAMLTDLGIDIEELREMYALTQPQEFRSVDIDSRYNSYLVFISLQNDTEVVRRIQLHDLENALSAAGIDADRTAEISLEWNEDKLEFLVNGTRVASLSLFTDVAWDQLCDGQVEFLMQHGHLEVYEEDFEELEPIVEIETQLTRTGTITGTANLRNPDNPSQVLSIAQPNDRFEIIQSGLEYTNIAGGEFHIGKDEFGTEFLIWGGNLTIEQTEVEVEVVRIPTPGENNNPRQTETPAATPPANETPIPPTEAAENVVVFNNQEHIVTPAPRNVGQIFDISLQDEPQYQRALDNLENEVGTVFEQGGHLYVEIDDQTVSHIWLKQTTQGEVLQISTNQFSTLREFEVVEEEEIEALPPVVNLPNIGSFAGSVDPNPAAVERSPAYQELIKILPREMALNFASIASGGSILETVVVDADDCRFTGSNSASDAFYEFHCGEQGYTSFSNMTRFIEISETGFNDFGPISSRPGDVDPRLQDFFDDVEDGEYTRVVMIVNRPTNPNWNHQAAIIIAVSADSGIEISSNN